MTPKCAAITRGGQPCKGLVRVGNEYCPAHDPARIHARKKSASKAGRAKSTYSELGQAKCRIKDLVEEVIEGDVDKGKASIAFQGLGVLRRFLELERRVKEAEELEVRIAELEELVEKQRPGYTPSSYKAR